MDEYEQAVIEAAVDVIELWKKTYIKLEFPVKEYTDLGNAVNAYLSSQKSPEIEPVDLGVSFVDADVRDKLNEVIADVRDKLNEVIADVRDKLNEVIAAVNKLAK